MGVMIFVKLAWRNILRNKRRTLIAGTAIGIGLAAMIYMDAIMIGMENNMVATATSTFLGDGQIGREGFRKTFEAELTINNVDEVVKDLAKEPLVDKFTKRVLGLGMISSPANVSGVSVIGIDPATEPDLSKVDEAMIMGSYFEGDDSRQILIGRKLAELLEVELGDRIVVTVAEAHTGDLSQEMFRVSGIYYFNVAEMDQRMAFVRLDKAQAMMGLTGQAHQIALKLHDNSIARVPGHDLWMRYSVNGNEAVGWTTLLPQLDKIFNLSKFGILILGVLLFAIVSLGIINTLFMSLYERMFEFGVIRALGTTPFAMGRLVIFEAGVLGLISQIMGCLLAAVTLAILSYVGIDYGGIEFAGVTIVDRLYPEWQVHQFVIYPAAVLLFTMVIALYPAIYAAKLTPARAMRKSF